MKQMKIANWLKGLTILLAIMGIAFFGGITFWTFAFKNETPIEEIAIFILFRCYTAIFCYAILFQFWKVCTQIGKDNSFSLENAKAFHQMGMFSVAIGAGYFIRIVWFVIMGEDIVFILVYVTLFLLSGVFLGLCEALSQLIRNAYEVKRENKLTI